MSSIFNNYQNILHHQGNLFFYPKQPFQKETTNIHCSKLPK
jgi:hypothetical protein